MYGTFRREELRLRQRLQVGDKDEFPWFMLFLFLVIMGTYSLVMYGSWDVATRLEVLGTRSSSVMKVMGQASTKVGDKIEHSVLEGKDAMTEGLWLMVQEVEHAMQETATLKAVISQMEKGDESVKAEYDRVMKVLTVQGQRVRVIRQGLRFVHEPNQANDFVDSLSSMMLVLSPLAELLPGHEVAARSLRASQQAIAEVQRDLAQIQGTLASLDHAVVVLEAHCKDFAWNVSILDRAGLISTWEATVIQDVGNLSQSMNLSTMTSFANFSGSEYMKKFMDLELVRDWSKLRDFEKTEVWAMANRTREASWELTRVVRSEAAGILDEVLVLLTATARNMADQLSSLESYALATGILTEHAVNDMADFYKKTVMVCVAVACGMALLAFVYACYLEYVYENNEVARAFETDPAARQGCCWGCVNCIGHVFHYTGFYALILLQDAVSLALVIMTLIMGTVSLAQIGVAEGCGGAPLLSSDQDCSAMLRELGAFVGGDLLAGAASCREGGVLICEDLAADVNLVYSTLLAAIVGCVVSCCIPRRLLVVWMSAHQSIKTAEALADAQRKEDVPTELA